MAQQNVIIIGAGEVGQHIARRLTAEGHQVTVIDQDPTRVESVQTQLDALVIRANGASLKTLREVGVERADLLLAVTASDEANLIATLAAHQLGTKRTVARVRDVDYFGTDQSFAHDVLGIDFIIHPERFTADDLADAILLPGAVNVEYFGDGLVAVAEAVLTDRSPLVSKTVGERVVDWPHFIVGIVSNGTPRLATPEQRLHAGDHVLVAAARENIGRVVAQIAGQAPKVRDVVIFGGGRVGLRLARRLVDEGRFSITVLESDGDRARYIAERLPSCNVVFEEGLRKEMLLAHGVDRADAFVACAGEDRQSLLGAMHAKQLGAGLCLAVVSREEYMPLVSGLGIDGAFSPRLATADAILRFLRGDQVRAMHLLFSGAEVLEVLTDTGCKMDDVAVEKAKLPKGVQIAAIIRDQQVIVPRAGQRVHADDRVVLFGLQDACAEVERLFDA